LGILSERGYDYRVVECPLIAADPDLIWLPNTIVTGTDKGEDSPIRRLRSAGDVWTLRLFIDLYHAHSLTANGGIDPFIVWQRYERKLIGEQGLFNVWAFKPETAYLRLDGPLQAHESRGKHPASAVDSVQNLQTQGLLTFVPHLWEHDSRQAEVIHAYGIPGYGEEFEIKVGEAAHTAAFMMALDSKIKAAATEGYVYLAPVRKTLPNVQLVGIGRLRYRPHTSKTSEWLAELAKSAPGWVQHYREMAEKGQWIKLKTA
jgi:hypothetical protein